MREDLDKQLCEKYPKIFAQRHLDPSQTCMCWGIAVGDGWYNIIDQLCGNIQWHIDQHNKDAERNTKWHDMRNAALVGDWTLFDEKYKKEIADPQLAEWVEKQRNQLLFEEPPKWFNVFEPMEQLEAVQVKEKFGGLRFYTERVPDDYIRGLISMAEAMADVTCEECGAPGKKVNGGWIVTLCDQHEQALRIRRAIEK